MVGVVDWQLAGCPAGWKPRGGVWNHLHSSLARSMEGDADCAAYPPLPSSRTLLASAAPRESAHNPSTPQHTPQLPHNPSSPSCRTTRTHLQAADGCCQVGAGTRRRGGRRQMQRRLGCWSRGVERMQGGAGRERGRTWRGRVVNTSQN